MKTNAEIQTGQTRHEFKAKAAKNARVKYLLHLPEDYTKDKKEWPLILFLHGAGERGDNLELVKAHGPPKIAEQRKNFPFIVVSPQCSTGDWWSGDVLKALLDDLVARYRIDEERIYLTGLSMGGFDAWSLAIEQPDLFAAIAPVCGGGAPEKVGGIKHVAVWVFHGAKDDVVPLDKSREMVDALKKCGGSVKFTVYPEAGHDSWTETYDNPELYEWFLRHERRRGKTGAR